MDMARSTTAVHRSPRSRPRKPARVPARLLAPLRAPLLSIVLAPVLALVLASCHAPAPDRPAPAAHLAARPSLVPVTPATFARRVLTPGSALILGTHGNRQATLLPLATTPSAVLVDIDVPAARPATSITAGTAGARPLLVAAWLVPADPPSTGTARPAPTAPAGAPALPLPDPDVSQAPAAWLALRAAAHALGKDLAVVRVAAAAGTGADPALHDPLTAPAIAAGLMASLTGAPALPRAPVPPALLLPDHTVLVLAATPPAEPRRKARSGARREQAASRRSGRDHGGHSAGLWDVRAAFARRTGTSLRGPRPVRARDMALAPALIEHLAARYLEHRGALLPHWTVLLGLTQGERAPASLHTLVASAQDQVAAAERARARGETLAAHEHMAAAGPAAMAASVLWQALARLRASAPAAARALVDALAAEADDALAAARARIRDARPTTLAGHLAVAAAVEEWLVATSLRSVAAALLAAHPLWAASPPGPGAPPGTAPGSERRQLERAERLIEALAPAVLALARGRAHAIRAGDALLVPAPARAASYQCAPAALAALAALDLAVSRSSPEPGPDAAPGTAPGLAALLERARLQTAFDHGQRWARGDVAPATSAPAAPAAAAPAARSVTAPPAAASPSATGPGLAFATPCTRAVAALAAAQHARADRGHALLLRHAAGPNLGKHLAALLPHADRAAREHARAALAATGAIPAASRLSFQSAREHLRTNDPAGALARFWAASLHAELAVTLARHAR
jgi:hypothetical protein